MAEVSIAIYGLGRTGTSIALALRRYNGKGGEHRFTIAGYDTSAQNVKEAQKFKALDTTGNRPEDIAANKDIIVIAMPYGEVEAVYDFIIPRVRAGAVIVDLSTLKGRSLQWAQKKFPEDVHLVCATPVINPKYLFDAVDATARATEDYFDNGMMMLMPSVTCIKEAITLATDFSTILGSKPHFYDSDEHDVLTAVTEIFPSVLGVLYFQILNQSKGWNDAQRLVNPAAGALSHHLFDTHPDDLRDLWLDSGQDLVRQIDEMITQLRNLRSAVASSDRDGVESLLESTSRQYELWINRRHNNRWQDDEKLDQDSPSFGSMMGNMFGSFVSNRLSGKKKND